MAWVKDLRPSHVVRMFQALRQPGANRRGKGRTKGLSETSLQHTHAALRSALDYAVRQRLVPDNVMADVDRPKRQPTRMRVWSTLGGAHPRGRCCPIAAPRSAGVH